VGIFDETRYFCTMTANYLSTLTKYYQEIAKTATLLWEKGWAERNGGNISRMLPEQHTLTLESDELQVFPLKKPIPALAKRIMLITGTGTRMRDVANNPQKTISCIAITEGGIGYQLITPDVIPSSEFPSHLMIQDFLAVHRPGYTSVVHTHATQVVAMSHLPAFADEQHFCQTLWKMIPETYVFLPKGIALLPYQIPGSTEIAHASVNAFSLGPDVIIWAKHGVFAIAPDTEDAFDKIDLIEKSAEIYLSAAATGKEPAGLSDKDLMDLKKIYRL